ncbi:DNA processing protein [Chitinophaga skermanii]|uniref:DNA processing protein n=1 Tax=Chitinophaga skermanii TaxID=331697 RepID=A0A327Q9E6_9BACT|nr:DNA-processing protein DprA [Chitinophaga skermanii]RAI98426.1 DNA processing protein [Chitinophaga skermanii]
MQALHYQVALTCIPQVGHVVAKELLQHVHSAEEIFKLPFNTLSKIPLIGPTRAKAIKAFRGFDRVEQEVQYMQQHQIQPIFYTDPCYPTRLQHCVDAPILLYAKGNTVLNTPRVVSIIGTRRPTAYGKQLCEQLVRGLQKEQVLVISGLAYGIDVVAHETCLQAGMPTVGVLAHGFDMLYPPAHHAVANAMLQNGGLLTECMSYTPLHRQHFASRNRIVAGLADATIIVESDEKGGSLITADLAHGYHRDVMAFPGRVGDPASAGCLQLIREQKAQLVTSASDVLDYMNWTSTSPTPPSQQRTLFYELPPEEQQLFNLLQAGQKLPFEQVIQQSGLPYSKASAALLNLEMQAIVRVLPGKIYELC